MRYYYTPKYAKCRAFKQFDWFTLNIYTMTSYCTDLPFITHSSCSYCMDLPLILWWIRLIRQHFVVNCCSSGLCSSAHFTSSDAVYDGFIKLQVEKFTQKSK